jgi:hypothetical protein
VEPVVAGAVEGDEISETSAADAVVAAVVEMTAFESRGGTTDLAGWIANRTRMPTASPTRAAIWAGHARTRCPLTGAVYSIYQPLTPPSE